MRMQLANSRVIDYVVLVGFHKQGSPIRLIDERDIWEPKSSAKGRKEVDTTNDCGNDDDSHAPADSLHGLLRFLSEFFNHAGVYNRNAYGNQ